MWGASGDLGGSVGRHVRSKLKSLEAEKKLRNTTSQLRNLRKPSKKCVFYLAEGCLCQWNKQLQSKNHFNNLQTSTSQLRNLQKPSKTFKNPSKPSKNDVFDLVEGYLCHQNEVFQLLNNSETFRTRLRSLGARLRNPKT